MSCFARQPLNEPVEAAKCKFFPACWYQVPPESGLLFKGMDAVLLSTDQTVFLVRM